MKGSQRKKLKLSEVLSTNTNTNSTMHCITKKRKRGSSQLYYPRKKSKNAITIVAKLEEAVRSNDSSAVSLLTQSVGVKKLKGDTGFNLICEAVENNRIEIARILVEAGVSVNAPTGNNNVKLLNPLQAAVKNTNLNMVKFLLANGALANTLDQFNRTAMHDSIPTQDLDIVRLLLTHGADPNTVDESGSSALHISAKYCAVNIVEELLKYDARVDAIDASHKTPLFYAVENGSVEIVSILLRNGANANISDNYGVAPLHFAAACDNIEVIKDLLNSNAVYRESQEILQRCQHKCICRKYEAKSLDSIKKCEKLEMTLIQRLRDRDFKDCKFKELRNCYLTIYKSFNVLCSKFKENKKHTNTYAFKRHLKIFNLLIQYGAKVDVEDCCHSTALHIAVKNNSTQLVNVLLKNSANVNVVDKFNKTPLFYAVLLENKRIIKELLEFGADSNISCQGVSPLHLATLINSLPIIKDLIAFKADVNHPDLFNRTPLFYSIFKDRKDIMRYLIKNNASLSLLDIFEKNVAYYALKNGDIKLSQNLIKQSPLVGLPARLMESILTQAAAKNNNRMVKLALECGANVNTFYKPAYSLLHYSVKKNAPEMIKMFIAHNANVNILNQNGRTPLFVAIELGFTEIAQLLIAHGGDVNICDKFKVSPLHMSIERNNVLLAKELIKQGADVNAVNTYSETPLVMSVRKKIASLVDLLLKKGACVNVLNALGLAPLHLACKQGNLEFVKSLMSYGADINVQSRHGKTPLMYAIIHENTEIVRLILDENPDVNIVDKASCSALHYAVLYENVGTTYDLLKFNPNPNVFNNEGKTPLYLSVEKNQLMITEWLIRRGACVNASSEKKDFQAPVHVAAMNGSYKMLRILINAGADATLATTCVKRTPLECLLKGKNQFLSRNHKVVKWLLCHLVKLEKISSSSFPVCHEHDVNTMRSHRCLAFFCWDVRKEIDNMKSIFFKGTNTSLYDLWSASDFKVAHLLKNDNVRSQCKLKIFKSYVPRTYIYLFDQVNKGKKRLHAINLLKTPQNLQAIGKLVCKSVKIQYDILENIHNYLSTFDILNLIEASKHNSST